MKSFIKIKEKKCEIVISIDKIISLKYCPDAETSGWDYYCFITLDGSSPVGISKENYDLILSTINKQESPWVIVEEQLPENDEMVLVANRVEDGRIFYCENIFKDGEWQGKTTAYHTEVAWMQIPKFNE